MKNNNNSTSGILAKNTILWVLCICAATWFSVPAQAQSGRIKANGVTLTYEILGAKNKETLLLIAGTGMQLTGWPPEFCTELVNRGFRVIRFDNRDVGLSTKLDQAGEPNWAGIIEALTKGQQAPLAYTVDDMAKDAVGLLNALHIRQAHLIGVSGGAIIAQIVAARYPDHVRSLTTIMSTTGNPALPPMKPEIQTLILSNPPLPAGNTKAIIAQQAKLKKAIGSPDYSMEESKLKTLIEQDVERSYYPVGEARQGAAALAAGDRRQDLQTIKVPTLVIHGELDPLVPVEAGKEVAATIPGAELRLIPGMGHDLPLPLIKTFSDAIAALVVKANNI